LAYSAAIDLIMPIMRPWSRWLLPGLPVTPTTGDADPAETAPHHSADGRPRQQNVAKSD
jgi:hypothetical protein